MSFDSCPTRNDIHSDFPSVKSNMEKEHLNSWNSPRLIHVDDFDHVDYWLFLIRVFGLKQHGRMV